MTKILFFLALAVGIWIWWRRRGLGRATIRPSEARRLLGVDETATVKDVREAHRRLIARVHPDAGGSAELATRVNAARDALISELNRKPS